MPCQQRIAALIHHTRNRLGSLLALPELASRPDARETLQAMAADLATVMALLRAGDAATPLQRHEVTLPDWFAGLAAEVRALCSRTAPALTLHVGQDFSRALFPVWTLDSQLVRLVVLDAVMNACRHARSRIALTAGCTATELVLAVADDGPGFPPAWLAALPDSTAAARTLPAPHGTGMGLVLARRIAAWHQEGERQGRLELANGTAADAGCPGAVFRLVLP